MINKSAKKVFLKNFGCQMNVRDSEVIFGILKQKGFKITDDPKGSNIIIFNTCSVRQHAEDKAWSEIGRFKEGKIIGLVGCMAQNYGEEAFNRAPNLSFVVGPNDIAKLPAILEKLTKKSFFETKFWETEGEIRPDEIYHAQFYNDKKHAFVVISEGCSNFCSYCVVPYVRGKLRHRSHQDILQEIKEAVGNGIKNITLLGQNVNSYSDSRVDFIQLLKLVDRLPGVKEFGFITSHPKDASVELFKTMQGLKKIRKYLHLPVQSGSDRILKLMNRGYTRKEYLDLISDYRKIVKGGILTSDIIIGFPTETEDDFKDSYDLAEKAQFDAAYLFKYSPRPHTQAKNLPDDVPREVKEKRHAKILNLQKKISTRLKCAKK
jgi:tRNA-2-methylthio-N6-dimethylallyladenosine synthase